MLQRITKKMGRWIRFLTMTGKIKRIVAETKYKLKIKPVLEQATLDELIILNKMLQAEMQKRNKRK